MTVDAKGAKPEPRPPMATLVFAVGLVALVFFFLGRWTAPEPAPVELPARDGGGGVGGVPLEASDFGAGGAVEQADATPEAEAPVASAKPVTYADMEFRRGRAVLTDATRVYAVAEDAVEPLGELPPGTDVDVLAAKGDEWKLLRWLVEDRPRVGWAMVPQELEPARGQGVELTVDTASRVELVVQATRDELRAVVAGDALEGGLVIDPADLLATRGHVTLDLTALRAADGAPGGPRHQALLQRARDELGVVPEGTAPEARLARVRLEAVTEVSALDAAALTGDERSVQSTMLGRVEHGGRAVPVSARLRLTFAYAAAKLTTVRVVTTEPITLDLERLLVKGTTFDAAELELDLTFRPPRPTARAQIARCCTALQKNMASAPREQRGAYLLAISACQGAMSSPDERAFARVKMALGALGSPGACK